MGQDWSLTYWPHPSVLLATRSPTGCSLGNVSTAYWNFFDEPEFQVTEEHELHERELRHVGLSLVRIEITDWRLDGFLQISFLHQPELSYLGLHGGSFTNQEVVCHQRNVSLRCLNESFGLLLPWNETVAHAVSWDWNVKEWNGFLCELSLGVIHCVYSSFLSLTTLP